MPSCSLCPHRPLFSTSVSLKQHAEAKHSKRHTEANHHLCALCVHGFKTKEALQQHTEAKHLKHSKQHLCALCVHGFKTKEALQQHTKDKHPRQDFCALCGHGFKTKEALKQHTEAKHLKHSKQHLCPLCRHGFKTKEALQQHRESKHWDYSVRAIDQPQAPVHMSTFPVITTPAMTASDIIELLPATPAASSATINLNGSGEDVVHASHALPFTMSDMTNPTLQDVSLVMPSSSPVTSPAVGDSSAVITHCQEETNKSPIAIVEISLCISAPTGVFESVTENYCAADTPISNASAEIDIAECFVSKSDTNNFRSAEAVVGGHENISDTTTLELEPLSYDSLIETHSSRENGARCSPSCHEATLFDPSMHHTSSQLPSIPLDLEEATSKQCKFGSSDMFIEAQASLSPFLEQSASYRSPDTDGVINENDSANSDLTNEDLVPNAATSRSSCRIS